MTALINTPLAAHAGHGIASVACTPEARITKSLLGYGLLAGPFYVTVSLAQALLHDGFDLRRHDWSLLAAGPWGWVQSVNLVLTGFMVIAFAVGALRAGLGRWAAGLVAVYGLGMVGGGLMVADPMGGYPVGVPQPAAMSWHGAGHMVAGMVGFAALIPATVVVGRAFATEHRRGAAIASWLVGASFTIAMAAIATGSTQPAVTLGFTASLMGVWGWLAALAAHLYRHVLRQGPSHLR